MEFQVHATLKKAADYVKQILSDPKNSRIQKATEGMELTVGPASAPGFGTDIGALQAPIFVMDSAPGSKHRRLGQTFSNATLDAMFKKDPESVRIQPVFNSDTKKFDIYIRDARGRVGINDSLPDLVAGQLLSPNGINQLQNVFKRPLIRSNARRLVNEQTGDNPWAEVMNLYLADFSGFASLPTAGAANNNMSQDVEVISGLMTAIIINMTTSYRLSVEETERAKSSGSKVPYSGQLIAVKQSYAEWVLDILTDSLIYFGNAATGTVGLLTVGSGATSWPFGSSLKVIRDGASTTKGADALAGLANAVADFLTTNQNMVDKVRVSMSPIAMNILSSMPYSAEFNPQSALKALVENFLAGENTKGSVPDIEFFADPLLSPNTIFNDNDYDLMIISSPEIGGGPDYEAEPLIVAGMPLDKFVYPVIPGQYGTPYKTLRRFAGIFAPYTPAIAAYTGFGTTTGE
jgi:hypothetical protein